MATDTFYDNVLILVQDREKSHLLFLTQKQEEWIVEQPEVSLLLNEILLAVS